MPADPKLLKAAIKEVGTNLDFSVQDTRFFLKWDFKVLSRCEQMLDSFTNSKLLSLRAGRKEGSGACGMRRYGNILLEICFVRANGQCGSEILEKYCLLLTQNAQGGLEFFTTQIESAEGDLELLQVS